MYVGFFNIKRQTLIETLRSVTVSNFVRLTVYKNEYRGFLIDWTQLKIHILNLALPQSFCWSCL